VLILETLLVLFGVVLFVVGYRQTHRNRMLAGVLVVMATLAVPPFVAGFKEGLKAGYGAGLDEGAAARAAPDL
jgi:hypothetical protein